MCLKPPSLLDGSAPSQRTEKSALPLNPISSPHAVANGAVQAVQLSPVVAFYSGSGRFEYQTGYLYPD